MEVCEDPVSLGDIMLPYITNNITLNETLAFTDLAGLTDVSNEWYNIGSSFLQPSIYDLNLFSPGIASQITQFSDKNPQTGGDRTWLWGSSSTSSPKFSVSGLTNITAGAGAVLSGYYNTYLKGGLQELFTNYAANNTISLGSLIYDVPNDHFPWTSYPDQRLHIEFDNTLSKLVFGLQPSKFGFYTRMFENAWPIFNVLKTNDVGYMINDIAGFQQKKLS